MRSILEKEITFERSDFPLPYLSFILEWKTQQLKGDGQLN